MKTALFTLALLSALLAGSTASAGVFVHAGPVTVGVGHAHYRPSLGLSSAPLWQPR